MAGPVDELFSEDLPFEWPTRNKNKPSESAQYEMDTTDFSDTTNVDSLANSLENTHLSDRNQQTTKVANTVAITKSTSETPQWKRMLDPSKRTNVDHLISMFDGRSTSGTANTAIAQSEQGEKPALLSNTEQKTADFNENMDGSSSTNARSWQQNGFTTDSADLSSSFEEVASRRLKVFGNADTYTNQKLDGLLSSLQGSEPQPSQPGPVPAGQTQQRGQATRRVPSGGHDLVAEGEGLLNLIRSRSIAQINQQYEADHAAQHCERQISDPTDLHTTAVTATSKLKPPATAPAETSLDALERELERAPLATIHKKAQQPQQQSVDLDTTTSSLNGSTLSSLTEPSFAQMPPAQPSVPDDQTYNSRREPLRASMSSTAVDNSLNTAARLTQSTLATEHGPKGSWHSATAYNSAAREASTPANLRPRNSMVTFNVPHRSEVSSLEIAEPMVSSKDHRSVQEIKDASLNLEAKPSITSFGHSLQDSTPENDTTNSHHGPSENENIHPNYHESHLPRPPLSQRASNTAAGKFSYAGHAAFRPSAGLGANANDSVFEPSMININTSRLPKNTASRNRQPGPEPSIILKDTTFSASLLELAHRMTGVDDLKRLRTLDLSHQTLDSIAGLDDMTPNLYSLNLASNNIEVVEGLPPSVVRLDISNNNLGYLTAFPLCFLVELDVSGNNLTDLQCLNSLRALSHLNISNNKLKSTRGIDALQNLTTVNMDYNQLTSLSCSLSSLKSLSAKSNKLSMVKLDCPSLEQLDLDNNCVEMIEPLLHLRQLSVCNNSASLIFMPNGWPSLKALEYDGNSAISGLRTLGLKRFSWLGGETPQALDSRAFLYCESLSLTMPNLSLQSLFGCLLPLQQLDLLDCGLSSLPGWLPRHLPALLSLNLAYNDLGDNSLPVLSEFRGLRKLSLYGNRISNAANVVASFASHRHLGALDLRRNPVSNQFYIELAPKLGNFSTPLEAYNFSLSAKTLDANESYSNNQLSQNVRETFRMYWATLSQLQIWWLDGMVLDDQPAVTRVWRDAESKSDFAKLSPENVNYQAAQRCNSSACGTQFVQPEPEKSSVEAFQPRANSTIAEIPSSAPLSNLPPLNDDLEAWTSKSSLGSAAGSAPPAVKFDPVQKASPERVPLETSGAAKSEAGAEVQTRRQGLKPRSSHFRRSRHGNFLVLDTSKTASMTVTFNPRTSISQSHERVQEDPAVAPPPPSPEVERTSTPVQTQSKVDRATQTGVRAAKIPRTQARAEKVTPTKARAQVATQTRIRGRSRQTQTDSSIPPRAQFSRSTQTEASESRGSAQPDVLGRLAVLEKANLDHKLSQSHDPITIHAHITINNDLGTSRDGRNWKLIGDLAGQIAKEISPARAKMSPRLL